MAAARERIEHLLDIASALERTESEGEIYGLAVAAAADVLAFDACSICTVEGDVLTVQAATARELHPEATPLAPDEGVAGRSLAEGETVVVADVGVDPDANPVGDYRSVLSIPLGDGVFQALSTAPDAFTETDRELAELLVTHVAHALDRVRYEGAITRERDRFAALFQNVPDPAVQYVIDDDGPRIEAVNSAFVRVFGYAPEDVVGARLLDLLVPDDGVDDASALYETVGRGERIDREVTRLTEDGPKPFLLRSVPVSADADRTGYFIYTDVSAMRDRQRRLERQNERLEEFTNIVSHDLRNPLSIARGYATLAREDPENLDYVEDELDRMGQMIDDLLSLARRGAVVGDRHHVAVGDVARTAWEHVETGDATLAVVDPPVVEADPERLSELLENLYRNSVEHGSTNSRPQADDATLTVTVGRVDGGFFVADDGRGIPPDEREEVLEMGYSTSNDGTGFGLGIVRDIANAHGWTVAVTEGEDGGARFEFETGQ